MLYGIHKIYVHLSSLFLLIFVLKFSSQFKYMEIEKIGEKIARLSEIAGDISCYCEEAENEGPMELQLLNLHGNLLRSLDGLPDVLPFALQSTLVELNLSSNMITSSHLPELVLLSSLRILDLSGNRLSSIDRLPNIPSLLSLSVAFNALENLYGVRNCPNLVHLDCHGNRISDARGCVELEMLGSLEELWFASSEEGRGPNPICSRPVEIMGIFDYFRFYGRIDGRNRSSWALEVPAAVSLDSITPRFDRLLHKQQKQLIAPLFTASSRYEADVVKNAVIEISGEFPASSFPKIAHRHYHIN
jgi:Leucine-rich repeat (LRR) protein